MLFIFKNIAFVKRIIIAFILFSIFATGTANASGEEPDTNGLKKLYPHHYKVQFAGDIGFLSAGFGYDFFNNRMDLSCFYGYVPKKFSKENIHSVSLQLTGNPFKFNIKSRFEYYPLNVGLFIQHTFGEEYHLTLPDRYPDQYYRWYPGRSGGLFFEGQLNYQYKNSSQIFSKIGFYYRIVTRVIYVTSKYSNSSIPLEDIFNLGLGIVIYY